MIKVFQLIESVHLGGAEIVAFNLSEFCNKVNSELEFTIVELHKTTDDYSINKKKELKGKDVRIISFGLKSKYISLMFGHFMLAYQIKKHKPDIIHSHTDLPDFVLSNTIRIFSFFGMKFPKILRTIHNTELWPTHHKLGRYVEKAFIDDWIVGVSEQSLVAYENLRNKNGLAVTKQMRVIYNGCKLPEKRVHTFQIDPNKYNIAFCGRFEHQKGIDVLIDRIKSMNSILKDDFKFHIIGNGFYQKEVLNVSNEFDNIILYDAVPNVADKLYAFDYLIIPSRFEGLVLISIEASLSRVPVIAAYAKGLSETLPPSWPLQFHLESETELLSIFENIKNGVYNLSEIKEYAYSFASRKFSHAEMIDAYTKLYNEIYS